jgi:DNA invertase Pin-like site-specific DNA recombinase
MLAHLRPGDTAYVYKLDRLGRSSKHLLDVVAELEFLSVGLVSLTHAIDTNSAGSSYSTYLPRWSNLSGS